MRDVVYYVAVTLDGYIAHADGSFDGFPWDEAFVADLFASFPETIPAHLHRNRISRADNKWFDAVLMGRKTYEVGVREGITCPYPTLDQYVFSRTMQESPDEQVELVTEHAVEVVTGLKEQPGKAVWLCGGADLATTLLKASLIDRLILKVNPVLFGSGIPLFLNNIQPTELELTDSKAYGSGHVVLHYRVLN